MARTEPWRMVKFCVFFLTAGHFFVCVCVRTRVQVSPAASAPTPSVRANPNSSPRPELATMTNVNVLDLHMNSQDPITRDAEENDNRKETRTESFAEWYAHLRTQPITFCPVCPFSCSSRWPDKALGTQLICIRYHLSIGRRRLATANRSITRSFRNWISPTSKYFA